MLLVKKAEKNFLEKSNEAASLEYGLLRLSTQILFSNYASEFLWKSGNLQCSRPLRGPFLERILHSSLIINYFCIFSELKDLFK